MLSDMKTELREVAALSEPLWFRAHSQEALVKPVFTGDQCLLVKPVFTGVPVQLQADRNQPEQTFSNKRGPARNCAATELQVDEAAETAPFATYTRVASLIMLRKLRAHARGQRERQE